MVFSLLDRAINQIDDIDAQPREPFTAFAEDEFTRQTLARVVAEMGWPRTAIECGGIAECMRSLGVVAAPQTLVVDVTDSLDPSAEIADLIRVTGSATRIIAVGAKNDVNLLHSLIAARAADYILKPLDPYRLREAITRVEPAAEGEGAAPGGVTIFTGTRGGVGTSTLALNAGWLIAHELKRRVALVDLDVQFGTLALAIDAEPGHGLYEALHSPDRVDELFVDRAMVRESERLFLFAAEEPLDTPPHFETEGLISLLEHLRGRFDRVVIDMPRFMLTRHLAVLSGVRDVVIATDLSLIGLRDANRLKRLIGEAAAEVEIKLAANMVRSGRAGQLAVSEFIRGFEGGLAHRIPLDERAAGRSANSGEPMARGAKRGKATVAIRRLAEELVADGNSRKAAGS
ncbi:MAG: AAA family ATPase [Alphaproteobacteria bacterium]|jgi:pilus assembly protein CpaE|nr:AAA family ATPase [Alphaproteobacteria bacterium]